MVIGFLYLRDCDSNECHGAIVILQIGADRKIRKNRDAQLSQMSGRSDPTQHQQLEIERSLWDKPTHSAGGRTNLWSVQGPSTDNDFPIGQDGVHTPLPPEENNVSGTFEANHLA